MECEGSMMDYAAIAESAGEYNVNFAPSIQGRNTISSSGSEAWLLPGEGVLFEELVETLAKGGTEGGGDEEEEKEKGEGDDAKEGGKGKEEEEEKAKAKKKPAAAAAAASKTGAGAGSAAGEEKKDGDSSAEGADGGNEETSPPPPPPTMNIASARKFEASMSMNTKGIYNDKAELIGRMKDEPSPPEFALFSDNSGARWDRVALPKGMFLSKLVASGDKGSKKKGHKNSDGPLAVLCEGFGKATITTLFGDVWRTEDRGEEWAKLEGKAKVVVAKKFFGKVSVGRRKWCPFFSVFFLVLLLLLLVSFLLLLLSSYILLSFSPVFLITLFSYPGLFFVHLSRLFPFLFVRRTVNRRREKSGRSRWRCLLRSPHPLLLPRLTSVWCSGWTVALASSRLTFCLPSII